VVEVEQAGAAENLDLMEHVMVAERVVTCYITSGKRTVTKENVPRA
jgi:hypothetical protein